jgi:cupin 2 domain-containing protein
VVVRGRLLDPDAAPARGEAVHEVAGIRNLALRQILSGRLDGPVDFVQDDDEWVMVLAGHAVLEVDDETVELGPGEWVLLPRGTPHRLLRTEPGTSWLAAHLS